MLRIIIIHYWNASKPTSIVETTEALCFNPCWLKIIWKYYTIPNMKNI